MQRRLCAGSHGLGLDRSDRAVVNRSIELESGPAFDIKPPIYEIQSRILLILGAPYLVRGLDVPQEIADNFDLLHSTVRKSNVGKLLFD